MQVGESKPIPRNSHMRREHVVLVFILGLLSLVQVGSTPSSGRPVAEPIDTPSVIIRPTQVDPINNSSTIPNETNGLAYSTFVTLWSLDDERGYEINETRLEADGYERTPNISVRELRQLSSDVGFTSPPKAPELWTERELVDFSPGAGHTSRYPSAATVRDGRFLRDVAVTLVAVQPSTYVHYSPTKTVHLIRSNGTVLGLVDYRTQTPSSIEEQGYEERWTITDHDIESVRVSQDSKVLNTIRGTHTPAIDFTASGDGTYSLSLEAKVNATIEHVTKDRYTVEREICEEATDGTLDCETVTVFRWRNTTEEISETVRVSDSLPVEIHDVQAGLEYVAEDDNRTRVILRSKQDFSALNVGESVQFVGVWRFFSQRQPGWERMHEGRTGQDGESQSEVLPVSVHAYPYRDYHSPTDPPYGSIAFQEPPQGSFSAFGYDLVRTRGPNFTSPAPSLHPNLNFPIWNETYQATRSLSVEVGRGIDVNQTTVIGLVRGVQSKPVVLDRTEALETKVDLALISENDSHATIRVELLESDSGSPIDLRSRGGYVALGGQRAITGPNGSVTIAVAKPPSEQIYARYEPEAWIESSLPYQSSRSMLWLPKARSHTNFGQSLFEALSLTLSAGIVYLLAIAPILWIVWTLDRMTGLDIWPPWRNLFE